MRLRHHQPMYIGLVLGLLALVSACSSEITLPEYAEQVESLVTEMNATLDTMDEEVESAASLEAMQAYANDRIVLRRQLLSDFEALDPPARIDELHNEAVAAIGALVAAEEALVARVLEAETAEEAARVWTTPEGQAAREADRRTIRLCEAAQETFDRTQAGEELEDLPWIPDEMKQVIRVALGCDAETR